MDGKLYSSLLSYVPLTDCRQGQSRSSPVYSRSTQLCRHHSFVIHIQRKGNTSKLDPTLAHLADVRLQGQRTLTFDIPIPTSSPPLGLTLQWSPLSNVDQVWHILEVTPRSPADTAGLLPYSDLSSVHLKGRCTEKRGWESWLKITYRGN